MAWPALKWSGDDKYVARVTLGSQISVYELPSMGLVGKKSIKIDGVIDFEWCPIGDRDREAEEKEAAKKGPRKERENMFAYWTPEVSNQPARVTLMAFPSRTVLRSKNLFNVSDCKIYWQNSGDFLCVKVDRHTKTKKSIFCNLEIFRVREKDYPVEVIELKDAVLDFSWEPLGERFAIIHSSDPNLASGPAPGITIKTEVSFYAHDKGKGDFKLLKTLVNKTTNTIRWSPRGRHVILTTMGNSNQFGLEFWDLDFSMDDRKDVMPGGKEHEWGAGIQLLSPPNAEHYGITDIEWTPVVASSLRVPVFGGIRLRTGTQFGTSAALSRRNTLSTNSSNLSGAPGLAPCCRRSCKKLFDEISKSTAVHSTKKMLLKRVVRARN